MALYYSIKCWVQYKFTLSSLLHHALYSLISLHFSAAAHSPSLARAPPRQLTLSTSSAPTTWWPLLAAEWWRRRRRTGECWRLVSYAVVLRLSVAFPSIRLDHSLITCRYRFFGILLHFNFRLIFIRTVIRLSENTSSERDQKFRWD